MNAGSVRNVAQNLLRKLFDIAGNLKICVDVMRIDVKNEKR